MWESALGRYVSRESGRGQVDWDKPTSNGHHYGNDNNIIDDDLITSKLPSFAGFLSLILVPDGPLRVGGISHPSTLHRC